MAEVTGGARFDAAGNLSDLGEAFAKIAEEMRSLYTLGYVPVTLKGTENSEN